MRAYLFPSLTLKTSSQAGRGLAFLDAVPLCGTILDLLSWTAEGSLLLQDVAGKAFTLTTWAEALLRCVFHWRVHVLAWRAPAKNLHDKWKSFFPIWHLVQNPSVLSVEMLFCLTFKGQFLPGIELFSATKYVGPVLDLHRVCLRCSTWEPFQGQARDLGMAWVILGRKAGFAGSKGDMEYSNPSCNLPQRALLRTPYKHRPKGPFKDVVRIA